MRAFTVWRAVLFAQSLLIEMLITPKKYPQNNMQRGAGSNTGPQSLARLTRDIKHHRRQCLQLILCESHSILERFEGTRVTSVCVCAITVHGGLALLLCFL